MNINELQNGDIIAVQSKGFLGKSIQYFMKVYARKFYGIEPLDTYNHTMTVVSTTRGEILVAEAIKEGFVVRPIEEALNWEKYTTLPVVIRPRKPFTSLELYRMRKLYLHFAYRNIEYEVTNFFWWMPYILSKGKIDLAPENNEDKLFCYETSSLLWNGGRFDFWEDPSKTTTVDMILSEKTVIYDLEYDGYAMDLFKNYLHSVN